MRKKINFNAISLIISILVICFTVSSYVFAVWQEPTAGPPGNNILPPINVSSTGQNKLGDFGIGGGSGQPVYWLSNYYGTLRFNSASPAGTRLVIGQDGNVGIGTTGPGAPLDVNATDGKHIRLQEGITDYGEIGYGYNVGNKSSTWIGTNINSTSLSRAQSNTANSSWYALFNSNADVFTVNRIAPAGSDSTFLTINSSGNVGIGTASPDSNYRLTVAGGGVKAENSSAQPAGYFS